MKGLEPRPAWARPDVEWRCWLMMSLYRWPHFALSTEAAWRPWIVLCAVACAMLGGCRSGKPGANCTTGVGAGAAAAAPGEGCGHGSWCLLGRSNDAAGGPVLSPFLPVPTYNVYSYAATPLTVVPVSPVSGPASGSQPPEIQQPPLEGEAIPLPPPSGPLPAPWRDVPGEPLPRPDDAPRFEGRATAAAAEESAVPAAAQPATMQSSAIQSGGSILRLRAETLESRPTAGQQAQ